MVRDPLYAMVSAATGTDNWSAVSTVPGSLLSVGPFHQSEQLRALQAGEVRITGLMRHEGESWSGAVRVTVSRLVFCGPFEIRQEPPELIEHLPGGGKVFFREFELERTTPSVGRLPERPSTARMREASERLQASGEITAEMTDLAKHGCVLEALKYRDKPPHGYGIDAFVRNVLGKSWGRRPK